MSDPRWQALFPPDHEPGEKLTREDLDKARAMFSAEYPALPDCNTTKKPLAIMETPVVVDPQPTAVTCKHGLPACVRCGHATRDSVHTTRAGMGAVARIKR